MISVTRMRTGPWLAAVGLSLAAIVAPATGASAAAAAGPPTVPNGIKTTDLAVIGTTAASLAAELAGAGVSVSNVTYKGASAQAGTIDVLDPAVVSFNHGVIMSSGRIADVVGPNKSDGITGDMAGGADADLDKLIAGTQTVNPVTFDAASLEFDFVPTANNVYFTYTFGSDEYLEWVNLFNDVFGFYVNGTNCATVPSGGPVSIDTINAQVNPALFRDNSYSSPPANPINIESDGLSVEMICSAAVTPNAVNHMKLAIADTSDQILDSVVMIKAGSLSTTAPESCNNGVDDNSDTTIDMDDPLCQTTTTPPAPGQSGIGSTVAGVPSGPPFTGNEGSPITLDAAAVGFSTFSADTLSTVWSVSGINGTTGSCTISPAGPQPLNTDGSAALVAATCPNEGEYVATVSGLDVDGKDTGGSDVDFFVHNAPPAVAITAPASAAVVASGKALALSAAVTDPGTADSITCKVAWGDGSKTAAVYSATAGTCKASHTFTAAGAQLISITATDNSGDSAADAVVVTVVDGAVTPDAPAALTAVAASTKATLSWSPAASGGTAVTNYRAQSATDPAAGNWVDAVGCKTLGNVAKCIATGLTNGTSYSFRVAAKNAAGWGAWSAESVAVTPATKPGAPTVGTATQGAAIGTVDATWTEPISDGGAAISNYRARAYLNGTTASKYCDTLNAATACTIIGLPTGSYSVKVQAYNALGWSVVSAASNQVLTLGKPMAPTGVSALAGPAAGQASASWSAPAYDGGSPVTKYVARAFQGATALQSCTVAVTTANPTPTSCLIKGLVAGDYTFKVIAYNANGTGTWSPPSAPVTIA